MIYRHDTTEEGKVSESKFQQAVAGGRELGQEEVLTVESRPLFSLFLQNAPPTPVGVQRGVGPFWVLGTKQSGTKIPSLIHSWEASGKWMLSICPYYR